MKKIIILLISFLLVKTLTSQCTAPSFTVDLRGAVDTTAIISNKTRGGVCCGSSNCVTFLVYSNSNSDLIGFNVTSPAPSGAAYYQVNCGAPVSIGTPLCIKGLPSPFTITYCKPGGDAPNYVITAGKTVHGSNDISIQKTGCKDTLFVSNVTISSIVWTSIYPGTQGTYNSYLSCTAGCNSTIVTPGPNPPPYVDFKVSGSPNVTCGSFTSDTIRVYFVNTLTGTISPANPIICSASGASLTLTANISGGALPYKYDWSNVAGPNNSYTTAVSTAGTYSVIVTDKTKCPALILTKVIGTIPVTTFSYSSSSSNFCKNDPNPVPIFGGAAQPGLFSATPAGLTFVSTSTGVINLAGSNSGTYVVTNTISPSGSCSGSSSTTTITIYPYPAMTSASTATICSGNVVNMPLTSSSSSNFNWIAADNINTTGESLTTQTTTILTNTLINSGTSNEIVIYTVTPISTLAGNCVGAPQTVSVTVRPKDDATFSYPSSTNCKTGNNPVATITGLSGGTFSAGSGLVFLNSAGTINLLASSIGSYTVTYTTNGVCQNSYDFPINITTAPMAGFSFIASPYCQNAANPVPTYSPTASGGTFSSVVGLVFVSNLTGEIDLSASTPGTYTVTNTIAPSGLCGTSSATAVVTITQLKEAGFSYTSSPICQTSGNPLPTFVASGEAGMFSSTSGLSINASSGLVNLLGSSPGTYIVTNTLSAVAGCPVVTATNNITITNLPIATFNYSATPFCSNSSNPLPTFTGAGTSGLFSSSSVYLDINPSTGLINISNSLPGDYSIVNTIAPANGCPAVAVTVSITITQLPSALFGYSGTPFCSNSANPTPSLNVSGTNGVYTFAPSGLTIDANAGNIDLSTSTAGSYTVTNTVPAANGCPAVVATSELTITQLPIATFNYPSTPYCINGSNPLPTYTGGGTAGTFSATAGTSVTSTNGLVSLSGSSTGTYTVTNSIAAANGCPAVVASNTITINPIATANAASDATICASGSYTLAGSIGGAASTLSWTTSGSGLFSNATIANSKYTPSVSDISAGSVVLTISTNDPAGPCSFATDAMTLFINPTPTVSAGSTNTLTCSNTTLSLSGSGGGTYAWSGTGILSGSTTATPVINAPGTYSLVVNSPLGCPSNVATVSISQNTLAPTVSSANTGSLNCTVLSVNASATTSTTPVNYNWSGTGITSVINISTITVNQGGTFNYTVTNTVNNCKATGSQVVAQNTDLPIVASANSGSLNCTVLSVEASATTSTTPVSYNWSGTGITSATNISTITVNQGGTFNYTVTNTFNNCETIGSQVVDQNTEVPIVASANSGSLNCTVLSIEASATTSTTPVSYSWSGIGITSSATTSTITVNEGGTYNYIVTNSLNNCTTSGDVSITQNTVVPFMVASTSGSITCTTNTIGLNSSLAGMNYTWTAPSGCSIISGGSLQNGTGQGLGTYSITVTDPSNDCTFSSSISAIQDTTAPTAVSAGSNQSLICGVPTVTLSGTATPANSNINWLGGVCGSVNSCTTTACSPVTYTMCAEHPVTGCVVTSTVAVISSTDVPQATVNVITNSITCTNSLVTVGVTLSNSDPVSYAWSGSGISGTSNSSIITATASGTFSVVITNTVTNCQSIYSAVVPTNTTPVVVSISPASTITCSSPSISLNATPIGSQYSYTWNGNGIASGASTNNPVVNLGGDFDVIITNSISGCTGTATVSVPYNTVIPSVLIAASSITTTCANPTATLNIAATPSTNVTYTWTAPSTGSLNDYGISNPVASGSGVFTVVVTNTVTGCVSSTISQSTIEVIPDLNIPTATLSASSVSITCSVPVPSVNLSTNSGNASYSWIPTSGIVAGTENTATPSFSLAGTYSAVITNTNSGCSTFITNNIVTVDLDNTIPVVNLTGAANNGTITCLASSINVTATVTPNNNLTYSWTSNIGTGIVGSANQAAATFTASGIFTLAVTNTVTGCSSALNSSSTFTVFVDTVAPVPNFNYVTGCSKDSVKFIDQSTISIGNIIDWNWSFGDGNNSLLQNPANAYVQSNTYTVSLKVKAANGCANVANSVVNLIPPVVADFVPGGGEFLINQPISFVNQSSGSINYTWNFGDGNSDSSSDPIHAFNSLGNYEVMLIASNSKGCKDTSYVAFNIKSSGYAIPGGFTPNGDGMNDGFSVLGGPFTSYELRVFNAWGNEIFLTNSPTDKWDGSYKDTPQPAGTYIYVFNGQLTEGEQLKLKGEVNIIR